MRTLIALLVALPLAASAQDAAPQGPPPGSPPPMTYPAQPSPAPVAYPAQPSPAPAYPVAAPRPYSRRDPWYIGFGLGSGSGRAKDDLGSFKLSDGMSSPLTAFINFKVGATLTPQLLLGFDISALRTEGNVDTGLGLTFKAAYQISNYDAMVTWFPMERGLFLRGGVGLTKLSLEAAGYATDTIDGVNLTFGGGYAFWIGRTFNLTVNLDFSTQSYNSGKAGAPSQSNYTALWVGFDWY